MATVKPFRGVRYGNAALTQLICPPYDIISPREKERLKKRSPHNMVRLELPDASGGRNKYAEARRLFTLWKKQGALAADAAPALYFYEQKFTDHGRKMVRRGFFAALKVENPHGGAVKPHEKTLAKPKEDRLKLLRAVQANLSPIFGLVHDREKYILNLSKKLAKTPCSASGKDDEGTFHKLWLVEEGPETQKIVRLLAGQKIFIADGHHRYETAWNYSRERAAKKKDSAAEFNYVMIYICPMDDPGLSIWPTHRVVDVPGDFEEKLEKYFAVLPEKEFRRRLNASPQPLLVHDGKKARTLVIKSRKLLEQFMPDKCAAYRNLGVSILHSILLRDADPQKITYVKDEKETLRLAKERGHYAVLVPATPVEAIKQIALADQTMPQKSTYFYPKVASGIVIHEL